MEAVARYNPVTLCNGLDDDGLTEAINRVIAGLSEEEDHQFTDAAAAALAAGDQI